MIWVEIIVGPERYEARIMGNEEDEPIPFTEAALKADLRNVVRWFDDYLGRPGFFILPRVY